MLKACLVFYFTAFLKFVKSFMKIKVSGLALINLHLWINLAIIIRLLYIISLFF